jgi:hypothetical protein
MIVFGGMTSALIDACSMNLLGSGIHTFALARFFTSLINPHLFIDAVLSPVIERGIRTPVTYMYNKMFRTSLPGIREAQGMLNRGKIDEAQYRDILAMYGHSDNHIEGFVELAKDLPGAGDLATMQTKGAFDTPKLIAAPSDFASYMSKIGFTKEWADRFWTSHFSLVSMSDGQDLLHRGFWTKEQFLNLLGLHGVHPGMQEDVFKVAFKVMGRFDVNYCYDAGLLGPEDLIKARQNMGLTRADAEKTAQALIIYRTKPERTALRTEALNDYAAGLDTEEELRSNLAALGGRPELIDLYVQRAKYREDRDVKVELIKIVKDQAVKGIIDEAELRAELADIGVKPSRIEVHVLEVLDKRSKAITEAAVVKKANLTEAKVEKAWELGLIGDSDFTARLMDRNFTKEDAQLLLEIMRTPAPISPEEITRRKNAIQARINSTNRAYDLMFVQIDSQTTTLSDELADVGATLTETLNVYDTELTYLTEEAATATEAKLPAINQRIAVLQARRDVVISRSNGQLTKLQNNLAGAADRKSQLIKNRDAAIGDLQKEIQALPVLTV